MYLLTDDDPENDYLKQVYRSAVRSAFADTVAALSPQECNCLRDYYAQRLTVAQIAAASIVRLVAGHPHRPHFAPLVQ